MKRPMLACAGAVMAGILLAGRPWTIVLCGFLCLGAGMAVLGRRVPSWRRMRHGWWLIVAVGILAFLRHEWLLADMGGRFQPWDGQKVDLTGYVVDEPQWEPYGVVCSVRVESLRAGGERAFQPGGRVRITWYGGDVPADPTLLRYGGRIGLRGVLRIPEGARNPGGFDMAMFLAARGMTGRITASGPPLALPGEGGMLPVAIGLKWKAAAVSVLDRYLSDEAAPVMAGMLLGDTSALEPELEADFRTAGLSHIMAVSGANVAFLLMPVIWLLRKVGVNRRRASALSLPVLLVYVLMTGFDASIVRAAVMASLMLAGGMLWRRTDMAASLSAACVWMLLINSAWLFDAGFRLSFLATGAIGLFCGPLARRLPKRLPSAVRDTLAATVSAQTGVLPVLTGAFHSLSLVSVPVNLLVVPLTGVMTVAGAVLVLCGLAPPFAGESVGRILGGLIGGMCQVVRFAADLPHAAVPVPSPPPMLVLAYGFWLSYLRFGRAILPLEQRRRLVPAALLLTAVLSMLALRPDPKLSVTVADVGQGDAILIRTPAGAALLVDGGGSRLDTEGTRTGERVILPLLYDAGVLRPDLVVSTHAHADHLQGLATVVREVGAGAIALPAHAPGYGGAGGLDTLGRTSGIPVREVAAGDVLWCEPELTLRVLSPEKSAGSCSGEESASGAARAADRVADGESLEWNESSLVLRLEYRRFSMLLMADAGVPVEERLLAGGGVAHADVLKIGHHGSDSATETRFLRAVAPSVAVISVGRNTYGHPSPTVCGRLAAQGISVHATKTGGAWILRSNGSDFESRAFVNPVRSLFSYAYAANHAALGMP